MIDSPVSEADEDTRQGSTSPLAQVGIVWSKKKKMKMPVHVMIPLSPVTRGAPWLLYGVCRMEILCEIMVKHEALKKIKIKRR